MRQASPMARRWTQALDLLFPPRCGTCNTSVEQHGYLCAECWQKIHFISAPLCRRCGFPFEYTIGETAECGDCMREERPFAAARSVMKYDDFSRSLITDLKYADQTQMAPILGEWMVRVGQEMLEKCDAIIPVPLHFRRLLERKFNQSALLAYRLGRLTGKKVIPDGLQRIRHTPPQASLTRLQRLENVRTAFRAHPRRAKHIVGKKIVLIDDVMTTAATVSACTKALLNGDAAEVYVLTLARTVHADN